MDSTYFAVALVVVAIVVFQRQMTATVQLGHEYLYSVCHPLQLAAVAAVHWDNSWRRCSNCQQKELFD